MILREIIEYFDGEEELGLYEDVTFREKDAILLREECREKYQQFSVIVQQVHSKSFRNVILRRNCSN